MTILAKFYLLLFIFLFVSVSLHAQGRATFDVDGVPLYRVFDQVESAYGVKVYYHPDHIPSYETYISNDSISLFELFQQVTIGTALQLVKYDASSYIAAPERFQNKAYADEVVEGWNTGRYRSPDDQVAPLLKITQGAESGQQTSVVFSGKILDESTGEPLYGVTIFHAQLSKGTTTELDGSFELELPSGAHVLTVRLLGYLEQPVKLDLFETGAPITIQLIEQVIGMDEVIVSARSGERALRDQATGIERLSARELKQLPTLGGELNVLQSLTTQAGVSATSEGSSAITVRGGGLDQNLVLQGGMPIIYPAHALGFFPVFHPDMVSGVELYKGYVPARFGGRSTSVIDVAWKTGDYRKWSMNAGTSFFSSRLSMSGPIVKEKVSLVIGGRLSHLNYLLRQIRNGDIKRSSIGFADLSAKLSTKWKGGGMDVSGAYATDQFRYNFFFGYNYYNLQGRVEARQQLNKKAFLAAEITTSSFVNELDELRTTRGVSSLESGLRQHKASVSIRGEQSESVSYEVGAGATYYQSINRKLSSPLTSPIIPYDFEDPDLILPFVFGEVDWKLSAKTSMQAGLRVSTPQTLIPEGVRYRYAGIPGAGEVLGIEERLEETTYNHDVQVQPRVALTHQLSKRSSVAAAYSRLVQPISQLSTTVSPTPADMFFVASEHIPLTRTNGYSLTYTSSAVRGENPHGFEASVYYRQASGVNLGRQGQTIRSTDFPEQGVYSLNGYAYGVELGYSLRSRTSSVDLSYGFGRSWLNTDVSYSEFRLSTRDRISAPTDLPHQINLQYTARFSGRTSFIVAWVYASGRPITAADAQLPFDGLVVPVFGQINASRLPATHRLDLSFLVDNSQSLRRGARLGFGISLYNIYQRENPFLAYYRYANGGRLTGYQFALIGDVIPALNLNLTWD